MSIKELLFAVADLLMIFAGFTYGWKFIRNYKNYLLGIEWIIVATSGVNFLIYGMLRLSHDSPSFHVAYLLGCVLQGGRHHVDLGPGSDGGHPPATSPRAQSISASSRSAGRWAWC